MTLILTAATKDLVIQVADTRLTRNGELFREDLVKTTLVQCFDAKLAISYTVLAYIERLRTDIWLYRILKEAKVWEIGFPDVIELIRGKLINTAITENNLINYGLTIVASGLGLNDGKKDLAMAIVTNFEKLYCTPSIKPELREYPG